MARDSQRQKVYDAERLWENQVEKHGLRQRTQITLRQAQDVLDILSDYFQVRTVTIQRNARIKAFGGWYKHYGRLIEVPKDMVSEKTVLHEFGHHLADERKVGNPGHGGGYVEAMLEIVEAWYCSNTARVLEAKYEEMRVKVGSHHILAAREAEQRKRERDGQVQEVFMVGYMDVGYYSDEPRPYYFKTTTGWFDETTKWTHGAKLYKTKRGAEKAAKKLYGSVTDYETKEASPIKVFKTRARYNAWLDELSTRSELDEKYWKEVLTLNGESVS